MTTSILLDPRFLDPGRDYRPAEGSPCIDAGDNTVIDRAAEEDLAGQTRFRDDPRTANTGPADGPTIDMGALEFQPLPSRRRTSGRSRSERSTSFPPSARSGSRTDR